MENTYRKDLTGERKNAFIRGDMDFSSFMVDERIKPGKKKREKLESPFEVVPSTSSNKDMDFFVMDEEKNTRGYGTWAKIAIAVISISAIGIGGYLLLSNSPKFQPLEPGVVVFTETEENGSETILEPHTKPAIEINGALDTQRETVTTVEDEQKKLTNMEKKPLDKQTNELIMAQGHVMDTVKEQLCNLLMYYNQDVPYLEKSYPDADTFCIEANAALQGMKEISVLNFSEGLKGDLYDIVEEVYKKVLNYTIEKKSINVAHYNEVVDLYNEMVDSTNRTNDTLIEFFDKNGFAYTEIIGEDSVSRHIVYSYSIY